MRKLMLLSGLTAVLLLNGCFFAAPQEVTYYDLSLPSPVSIPGVQLVFHEFENFSGAGARMRYRVDDNQQILDNLNKWANTPENMLRQYLLGALTGSTGGSRPEKNLTVSGRLEIFELDLGKKEAIMQLSYSVAEGSRGAPAEWQVIRAVVSLNESSPREFAKAFSEAAARAARVIRNDILNNHQAWK